jgi:hypothetical protein|tara:strand:+ start:547 stop:714 length:168 start_codon:yes stop_codon:yes gene_type:complete
MAQLVALGADVLTVVIAGVVGGRVLFVDWVVVMRHRRTFNNNKKTADGGVHSKYE